MNYTTQDFFYKGPFDAVRHENMVARGRSAGQIAKLHFFTPHAWIARFNANCLHESIIQARVTCPFSYCGSLHFNYVERPFVHGLSAQETVPNSDQMDRSIETWRNSTQTPGGVVFGEGNFRKMAESWGEKTTGDYVHRKISGLRRIVSNSFSRCAYSSLGSPTS